MCSWSIKSLAIAILASLLGTSCFAEVDNGRRFTGHVCSHSQDSQLQEFWEMVDSIPEETHRAANSWDRKVSKRQLLQNDEPQPFRLVADYQLEGLEEGKATFLKDKLIPGMIGVISRTLKLKRPVQEPLRLPRMCTLVSSINSEICVEVSNQCGFAQHNPNYVADATICSISSGFACSTQRGGNGAPNADFVLYVMALNETLTCIPGSEAVASAIFCSYDMENIYGLPRRPLAGFVNFCPDKITTDEEDFGRMLDTAVHEVFHAIFMDSRLMERHMMPDGETQSSVLTTIDGVPTVTSPAVRRETQAMLNCSEIEGAPLENEGGNGTRGNHWESRLFNHEIMVGRTVSIIRPTLSNVTLALAEDSGWYVPWYNATSILIYNHLKGCEFVREDCSIEGPNVDKDFCFDNRDPSMQAGVCNPDHSAVGFCANGTGLTDGCVSVLPFNNGFCSAPENQQQIVGVDIAIRNQVGARCFPISSDIFQRTEGIQIVTRNSASSACFETICRDGSLFVVIPETRSFPRAELECPEGETIDLQREELGFNQGLIGPCPRARDVCDFWGCPNDCSFNGQCYRGECHCLLGFGGVDCTQPACPDTPCPEGETCDVFSGLCSGVGETPASTVPPIASPPDQAVEVGTPDQGTQPQVSGDLISGIALGTGHLVGCRVFADMNNNLFWDPETEPSTLTEDMGSWALISPSGSKVILDPRQVRGCLDTLTNLPPPFPLWAEAGSQVLSALTSLVDSGTPPEEKVSTNQEDVIIIDSQMGLQMPGDVVSATPAGTMLDASTVGSDEPQTGDVAESTDRLGDPVVDDSLVQGLELADSSVLQQDLVRDIGLGSGMGEAEEKAFVVSAVLSNTVMQVAAFITGEGVEIRNIAHRIFGHLKQELSSGLLVASDLATPAGVSLITQSILTPNAAQNASLDAFLEAVASLNEALFMFGDQTTGVDLLDRVARNQHVHQTVVVPMAAELTMSQTSAAEFLIQTSPSAVRNAARDADVASPFDALGVDDSSDDDDFGLGFDPLYLVIGAGAVVVIVLLMVCSICCFRSSQRWQGDRVRV